MKRHYATSVTSPAGTLAAAPTVASLALEAATLESVQVIIPPGHSALTGVRVVRQDVTILPWSPGTWLSGDSENEVWEIGSYFDAGDLHMEAYNTDIFDHTFYLRFNLADDAPRALIGPPAPQPLPGLESSGPPTDALSAAALLAR